jgi:hypothetical protein
MAASTSSIRTPRVSSRWYAKPEGASSPWRPHSCDAVDTFGGAQGEEKTRAYEVYGYGFMARKPA